MKNLKGVWLSLITPFDENNKFDANAATEYIKLQDKHDFAGFLIGGSVGEGLLLTAVELAEYIALVRKISNKPIMLCIAAFSYNHAFEKINLDYDYLCITPCIYFKPHKEAIIEYFNLITNSTKPIILYNNPTRVGVNIDDYIYGQLYDQEKIFGQKECNSDQFDILSNKYSNWLWFTGNDDFAFNKLFLNNDNAAGVITTLGNIEANCIINLWNNRKNDAIRTQYANKWEQLCDYAYSIPNPQAVKLTLAHWGVIKPYFRAQFSPLSPFAYVHHFSKH